MSRFSLPLQANGFKKLNSQPIMVLQRSIILPRFASMRRPLGVKPKMWRSFQRICENPLRQASIRTVGGRLEAPCAGWGPTRSGADHLGRGLRAQAKRRSHPDGAVKFSKVFWIERRLLAAVIGAKI